MAILFGTAKSNYPDFGDPSGGAAQFENRAAKAVSSALSALGTRAFQNSYVEDGVQNVPGTSFTNSRFQDINAASKRKIFSQHAQATILIKKRMFSTLRQNYDTRFMDDEERVFLRAIKNLFARKCDEIAFYENLVVLEKVIEDPSFLYTDSLLDKMLGGLFSVLDIGFGIGDSIAAELSGQLFQQVGHNGSDNWLSTLMRLRDVNERSKQNKYTTWITNPRSSDVSATGAGVGVIELTMMTNVSSTIGLKAGSGKCTVTIEDPYKLTRITESDIDFALKKALAEEDGFPAFFDLRGKQLMEQVKILDR